MAVESHALLAIRRASEACGVTRLANVTGLDVLGVPVFQAVRPWGRSLSVHQGKGLTEEAAMIGALMEAIECDHAETFELEQRHCAFDDLEPAERAPSLSDFAAARASCPEPSRAMAWVQARRVADGRTLWTPWDCVSLDLSRAGSDALEKSSNGLGARLDVDGACLKAILELIERDAEWAWRRRSFVRRADDQVESASIDLDWFEDLRARAMAHGLIVSIFHLPAVIAVHVFVCEIFEPAAGPVGRHRAYGTGCDVSAEAAFRAAVVEAAQSRLTEISGVRDDLSPPDPSAALGFGFALPPSSDSSLKIWADVESSLPDAPKAGAVALAEALAMAGYPHTAVVDLSRPEANVRVVKAFAPGLGANTRDRRPPTPGAFPC